MKNEELLKIIFDSEKWPSLRMPENLEMLNESADRFASTESFDSLLAAMLIYHQIIECFCMHLLECCHFYIQLAVFPVEIHSKIPQEKMVGYYISELKNSIDFPQKQNFLDCVSKYNAIRNKIVHQMSKKKIETVCSELKDINSMFDNIFKIYDEIQDDFRVQYSGFKKNVFSDDYAYKYDLEYDEDE